MLSIILSACVLSFLTVAVHATGIAVLVRGLIRHAPRRRRVRWLITRMLLRIIWWLVLLHLVEILVWGAFYLWRGCLPDAETAFYFSGVHLHDRWLRRCGLGEAVAAARTNRGPGGHPHVQLVHGLLLPCREPHPSIAARPSLLGCTDQSRLEPQLTKTGDRVNLTVCRQEKKAFEKPTKDCGCTAGRPEVVLKRAFGEVMALGRETPKPLKGLFGS